jgi:hypothetical protein
MTSIRAMSAPSRVGGHYVEPPRGSTSKTTKKVPEAKKILPFIAGLTHVLEIFRKTPAWRCAFLLSR